MQNSSSNQIILVSSDKLIFMHRQYSVRAHSGAIYSGVIYQVLIKQCFLWQFGNTTCCTLFQKLPPATYNQQFLVPKCIPVEITGVNNILHHNCTEITTLKSGWTNCDAIQDVGLGGPTEPCTRWGSTSSTRTGTFKRWHQAFSACCQPLFPVALMSAFPYMLSTSIQIGWP